MNNQNLTTITVVILAITLILTQFTLHIQSERISITNDRIDSFYASQSRIWESQIDYDRIANNKFKNLGSNDSLLNAIIHEQQ